MYTEKQIQFMRDSYEELGDIVTAFNVPSYDEDMTDKQIINYIGKHFRSAMRDFGLTDDSFDSAMDYDSTIATYFTNRVCYYMLKKLRMGSAVMYKFSSSKDGFSVEKQTIYKNINDLILQYDDEYKRNVVGKYHHGLAQFNANRTYEWINENE